MQKPKVNEDDLLMTSAAARELECSAQWIIQLERSGQLPAIKTTTGARLFKRSDIELIKRRRMEQAK